jgi:hypothetical protein
MKRHSRDASTRSQYDPLKFICAQNNQDQPPSCTCRCALPVAIFSSDTKDKQIGTSSGYLLCYGSNIADSAYWCSPVMDRLHRLNPLHRLLPARRRATTSSTSGQAPSQRTTKLSVPLEIVYYYLLSSHPNTRGLHHYIIRANSPNTGGCTITSLPQIYSVTW